MQFIDEQIDMWDYLTTVKRPIVIYGMGNGALKALAKCQEYKIDVKAIFASDDFVRGQSFLGYEIIRYSQIVERYGNDITILLAFGSESEIIIKHFFALADKHELLAPNFPLFGTTNFDMEFVRKHEAEFERVYALLADDWSRLVFKNICNYKLSGKIDYLSKIASLRTQDYQELFTMGSEEVYIDLGAYNGDTVKEFIELVDNNYTRIIAVEPDAKNFKKLSKWQQENNLTNLEIIAKGIWDKPDTLSFNTAGARSSSLDLEGNSVIEVESVDNILQGTRASWIKIDVEGAEAQALRGAAYTIEQYKPKMLVACYHREEDLLKLPLLIHELNPAYKIYFRKHPYVPAWEINIFAV